MYIHRNGGGGDLTIKYRSERRSIKSFDSSEPIPEDIVRREMDKQKEANEKRFYDRETLNRDIANIRNRTSASLYNLLIQDECGVDSLNERINKLRDQRELLKKPESSEFPKRKHVPPFGFSRIQEDLGVGCDDFVFVDPWDFEYRYAFALGNPNIYVIADKQSGLMHTFGGTHFESSDPNVAQVGAMLGSSFIPNQHDGLLLLRGDPEYIYSWTVDNSWFEIAGVYALAGIQVDRYTLDNVFDQTLVNNTTLLWDYTAFTWSHAENEPKDYNGDHTNSDAFLTASLDVDRDHRYIVWVKFEIGIKSDGNGLFWYSSAVADLICFFPWIEGGFCPSD